MSGIVVSALYMTSLVFIRLAVPADPKDPGICASETGVNAWASSKFGIAFNPGYYA